MIYMQAILVLAAIGGVLCALLLVADRFLCNYGPCQIKINDEDAFTVDGGCKLLDALYDQRVFIPSACGGQGTCGFCKVQVLDGGGPLLPTELPYLTPGERGDNVRLACQIKVKEDITIHVKEEFLNIQEFTAEVMSAEMKTADTRELRFQLKDPAEIDFRPGQYVQVFVPGSGDNVFRAYSVASPPSEKNVVELLVRLIPGGLGSTYLHNVQTGDEVRFTGPYGEFEMTDADTELICVGGGCGMAPMRSILRHIQETSPQRHCSLYFGARTDQDTMYMDEFEAMAETMPNLRIHYALSESEKSPDWDGETGFIHESVDRYMAEEGDRQAFLCGPPLMIDATMKVLDAKGVPAERVFYDKF